MSRPEDRQFERFRTTGAPDALAEAFDATAPELWRVAWYLSGGDRHRAEDALQSTFLTAIVDRGRWNATRPLRPWLLGILSNHVRKDRRRAARATRAPDVLEALPTDQRPSDEAAVAEVRSLVSKTMQDLPQPYREVVILHIEHGLTAQEIATSIDRKPGTVRTQVVRGLELLRKALPAGIAGGAALALPDATLAAQVLDRVRDAVMAHGSAVAATVPAALSTHPTWKIHTMIASLLICALATTYALWPAEPSAPPATPSISSSPAPTRTEWSDRSASARDLIVEAPKAIAEPDTPSVAENSTRVAVIVVDSDDKPLPNAPVMMMADGRMHYGHTDASGRAELVAPGSIDYYQVGVVGRAVMEYRFSLMPDFGGEHTLKLKPGLHLKVRVVDRNGAPVAKAMVEGVLGSQWARMYNPLGRTDGDGVLSLRDVATSGQLRAFASGHQLSTLRNVGGQVGETVEVTLRLGAPAVAATGKVVDGEGKPVEGASLAVVQFSDSPTRQYTASDSEGRFSFDWLTPGRHMIVGESFDGTTTRLGMERFEHHGGITPELLLQIEPAPRLTGTVRNTAGDPISNAAVYAEYSCEGVYDVPFAEQSTRTDADGAFVLDGLFAGPNRLRAGLEETEVRAGLDIRKGQVNEWHPRIAEPQPLSVRVVDERGQPLAGWRVALLSPEGYPNGTMFDTGEDGLSGQGYTTWRIPADEVRALAVYAPVPEGVEGLREDRHDSFPTLVVPPVGASPQAHVIRVPDARRLNCAITGQLSNRHGTVTPKSKIVVSSNDAPRAFEVTIWADPTTGAFSIAPLSPGHYTLRIHVPGEPRFTRKVRLESAQRLELGAMRAPDVGTVTVFAHRADGTALDGNIRLHVRVQVPGGAYWTARRQLDGSYVAKDVHCGDAEILVWSRDIPSSSHAIKVEASTSARVTVRERVTPTPIAIRLAADYEVFQQGWSGTIRVRDPQTHDLVMSQRVRHPFRGVFQRDLRFTLPLDPGTYRIEVESWDRRHAHIRATVPGGALQVELPEK